ncbi:ATP-dependent DNA helicase pif1-like [Watersipora subatra]|uniref:ATP-dependent DNA helicase pif1-like n=1 Tax=Watersipora subatra TaxID=2589382 RepID=UPI00355B000B
MGLLDQEDDDLPLAQPALQANPDFDWVADSQDLLHLVPHAPTFLIDAQNNYNLPPIKIPLVDIAQLNNEQRQVYDHMENHYQLPNPLPLRALVLGSAGTGKSVLIQALHQLLGQCCKILAPTGVAALNISGSTIHSFLHFAKPNDTRQLNGPALQILQAKCLEIKCIIIDELSMIGCRLINAIDKRLRQAFPEKSDQFFGGCSIIMFGDFSQLPPVLYARMFQPNVRSGVCLHDHSAYQTFDTAFFLSQCMRQANDLIFRDLLLRFRDGESTEQDNELLSRRFPGIADHDPVFNTATRLFPTCQLVHDYNSNRLLLLGNPIAQINSKHAGRNAHLVSSNLACGLQRSVFLSVGSQVMLRANLWVEKGLVNGSISTVLRIIYCANQGLPALPAFVVGIFPDYTGPTFLHEHPNSFPVTLIKRTWTAGHATLSRTGISLDLALGLTIHKSQGLTMAKAVIDIGHHEMTAGILFVALSRVRNINDLLVNHSISYQ